MKEAITVLKQTELLGQQFEVYGTLEEPLFKATDVARLINHSDVSTMMQPIDDDEKLIQTMLVSGQNRKVWMLTENGLYEVLMQSRKPIAKDFKKGVKAILKEIRKTGGYMVARADETPEEILARALVVAKATIERQQKTIEQQKEEIETQKGAVIASQKKEAVYASLNLIADKSRQGLRPISIDEFVNYLRRKGYDTGKKRLASWLRKKGYLCRRHGVYDQPSDMALDLLYMETNRIATITCHGVYFSDKVMITSIGRSALFGKFRKDVEAGVIKVGYLGAGEDEEGGAE